MKYELVNYCEFDKYAAKAYSLIHNEPESKNLGDITLVNEKEIAGFNFMTYSPPCQAFSVAGKQLGFDDERGILFFDALRIIKEKKPKCCIMENVKGLVGKKFKNEFNTMLKALEDIGYNNYHKVLNAKNYGVPQNRERVFIVSIRKDVDNGKFKFPEGFDNGIRLKHLLEQEVDEKYYISQEKTDKLIEQLKNKQGIYTGVYNQNDGFKEQDIGCTLDASYYKGLGCNQNRNAVLKVGNTNPSGNGMNGCVYSEEGLSPIITTNKGEGNKILQIGMLDIKGNEQVRRVYNPDGLSPTLNTMQGGNRQPKILEENELKFVGGSEGAAACQKSNGGGIGSYTGLYSVKGCSTRTRNYIDQSEQLEVRKDELSNSITTVQKDSMVTNNHRIRKLTPLECFRLMGFDDEDYYILKENKISNTQIYKMAGNSIVTGVLYYILLEIYKVTPYLFEDIKLGSFFSGIGAFEKAIERLLKEVNQNELSEAINN